MNLRMLVTGGAGFIGANFVRHALRHHPEATIVTLDLLTYAGSLSNLADLPDPERHRFVKGDIADGELVRHLLSEHQINTIVHFAAESHVDRSIDGPAPFIQTNIVGTFMLLEAAREVWRQTSDQHRFIHVSTDEVYGSLGPSDPPFSEATPYAPNSPYAASKASADHLVRSYVETYQFPAITTNCSNNYGPYQYPEKLIPLVIIHALTGKPIPVYGDGRQIRDWLYVEDHCEAISQVIARGQLGQTYNIGGLNEQYNIDIVHQICDRLDELRPLPTGASYRQQITHVTDRPGHDRRYAIDAGKIQRQLGWRPRESFATGIDKTIAWYLENEAWVNGVMSEKYEQWMAVNYSQRKEISPG
jgi:dTDP-glucose 4,6-dehydratase